MPSTSPQSLFDLTSSIVAHGERLADDYDAHELHQFRVHIRRTRSLLKQLHDSEARNHSGTWAGIFTVTGQARDFDVFLESSRELLTPAQHRLLVPLLGPHAEAGHDAVVAMLQSARWRNHLRDWNGYLDRLAGAPPKQGKGALSAVLAKARGAGSRALHAEDDFAWHKFRIAVKNLRYVADSGVARQPGNASCPDLLIEECKALQTVLGEWHDTVVQLRLINGPQLHAELGSSPARTALKSSLETALRTKRRRLLDQARSTLDASQNLRPRRPTPR